MALQEGSKMRDKRYNCDQCDFATSSEQNLKPHIASIHHRKGVRDIHKEMKQSHQQQNKFACDQCVYQTSKKWLLKSHFKRIHDQIKNFRCEQCDYTSISNYHLERHIKSFHSVIVTTYSQKRTVCWGMYHLCMTRWGASNVTCANLLHSGSQP